MKRTRTITGLALLTSLVAVTLRADEVAAGARVCLIMTGIHEKPVVGQLIASDAEALTLRSARASRAAS